MHLIGQRYGLCDCRCLELRGCQCRRPIRTEAAGSGLRRMLLIREDRQRRSELHRTFDIAASDADSRDTNP